MVDSSMSNEQSVIAAEEELEILRNHYIECLTPIVIAVQTRKEYPSLELLLECQKKANTYFNYAERFVANSGLLGAHVHGKWVTGLAENCHARLDEYATHINFLRSYKDELGGEAIEPSEYAFANMQRMVKEYLEKEKSNALKKRFVDENLPIKGFTMAAAEDEKKVTKLQRILNVSIGAIAVTAIVVLAVIFPNPTKWQGFVFRGCLALGLAALASEVTGFINLSARVRGWGSYFKIFAGGALAIFVLIWLVNPPDAAEGSSGKDVSTKEEKIAPIKNAE